MFLESDIYSPNGTTYQITPDDLAQHITWMDDVNSRLPAGSEWFIEIGHNGNGNIEVRFLLCPAIALLTSSGCRGRKWKPMQPRFYRISRSNWYTSRICKAFRHWHQFVAGHPSQVSIHDFLHEPRCFESMVGRSRQSQRFCTCFTYLHAWRSGQRYIFRRLSGDLLEPSVARPSWYRSSRQIQSERPHPTCNYWPPQWRCA